MSVNFEIGVYKCWVCDSRGKNLYRIVRSFGSYGQRQRFLELDGRLDLADFDKIYNENLFYLCNVWLFERGQRFGKKISKE